jgi:streptogramin lyase
LFSLVSCGASDDSVAPSLLVSSGFNFTVKRYDGTTGAFVNNFASGSPLSDPTGIPARPQFQPTGLVIGPDGNLYVSLSTDSTIDKVLRYDGTTGAFLGTFIAAGAGGLAGPRDLVFRPDGNLYISSSGSNQVLRYNGTTGAFDKVFASGFGLIEPKGIVFGPDGNLYVSSFSFDPTQATANQVLRFNGSGQPLPASGQTGATFVAIHAGGLAGPFGLVFGTDGNLYVSSLLTNQVLRYNGTTGAFLSVFVTAGSGGLDQPTNMVFGPDGNLYVSSFNSDVVLRYNGTTGAFLGTFASGGGLDGPVGLAFTQ